VSSRRSPASPLQGRLVPRRRVCPVWLVAGSLLLLSGAGRSQAHVEKVYWTMEHAVMRADVDGSNVETVVSVPGESVVGVAVGGGKLYWGQGFNTLRRADLDGSNAETLIGGTYALSIALDLAGGKIYWTDGVRIRRADLDGSHLETVHDHGGPLGGIALDVAAGWVYVTEYSQSNILRVALDGSSVQDLDLPADLPVGITLDVPGGRMYFANLDLCVVFAALDGSDSGCFLPSQFEWVAHDVAADPRARHLYWSNKWYGTGIWRRSLDGGESESVVPSLPWQFIRIALLDTCGDGVLDGGEECDDGNGVSCDGCSSACTSEAGVVCGDGVVNPACGEQCDDGNDVAGDGCEPDCTPTPAEVPGWSRGGAAVAALLLLCASAAVVRSRKRSTGRSRSA